MSPRSRPSSRELAIRKLAGNESGALGLRQWTAHKASTRVSPRFLAAASATRFEKVPSARDGAGHGDAYLPGSVGGSPSRCGQTTGAMPGKIRRCASRVRAWRDHPRRTAQHTPEQIAPLAYRQGPLGWLQVQALAACRIAPAITAVRTKHVVVRASREVVMDRDVVRASQSAGKVEDRLRQPLDMMDVNAIDADGGEDGREPFPLGHSIEIETQALALAHPPQRDERASMRLQEQHFHIAREAPGEVLDVPHDASCIAMGYQEDPGLRGAPQAIEAFQRWFNHRCAS